MNAPGFAELLVQYRNAADPETRLACVWALKELGEACHDAAGALIVCLGDPEPAIRAEAAAALSRKPFHSGRAAVALARCLDDPRESVRHAALDSLRAHDESAAEAAPQLMAALRHHDRRVRHDALELLESLLPHCGGIGPAISLAVSRCTHDADPEVRARATRALGVFMGVRRPGKEGLTRKESPRENAGPATRGGPSRRSRSSRKPRPRRGPSRCP